MKKILLVAALVLGFGYFAGAQTEIRNKNITKDLDSVTVSFDIETDVVVLKYPARWEEFVEIEKSEEAISFSAKGTVLFELHFNEVDGYLLGMYDKTPVYVISHDIDEEYYTAQEYEMLCSMQEDINVIIEHLDKDRKFKMIE